MVRWLTLCPSNAGGPGSNPGWGTKILTCHMVQPKKLNSKICLNKNKREHPESLLNNWDADTWASPITHNCARKQHHFIHCWKILLHFGKFTEENRRENACSDTQHIKYHHGNHTESSNTAFMKLLELSYMALSPKGPRNAFFIHFEINEMLWGQRKNHL